MLQEHPRLQLFVMPAGNQGAACNALSCGCCGRAAEMRVAESGCSTFVPSTAF